RMCRGGGSSRSRFLSLILHKLKMRYFKAVKQLRGQKSSDSSREGNAFYTLADGGTVSNMPYTYQGWTLYSRDVKLKKGPKVTIYFFSKRKPKSGKPMDEMPKNRKIDVNAPVEKVWSFLSDMQQVGRCVPGVENVEVLDATHARWTLTVKIGPLSQTIKVLTETLEQIPLRRGRFRAEAENIDMIGT